MMRVFLAAALVASASAAACNADQSTAGTAVAQWAQTRLQGDGPYNIRDATGVCGNVDNYWRDFLNSCGVDGTNFTAAKAAGKTCSTQCNTTAKQNYTTAASWIMGNLSTLPDCEDANAGGMKVLSMFSGCIDKNADATTGHAAFCTPDAPTPTPAPAPTPTPAPARGNSTSTNQSAAAQADATAASTTAFGMLLGGMVVATADMAM